MMKKLVLMLVLVFVMASVTWAAPYFQVATDDQKDHYYPSDVITIELHDDTPIDPGVAGFMIDSITDNTGGLPLGTALAPQVFNPAFTTLFEGILNDYDQLVVAVSASVGVGNPTTGLLYSFEYHVPDVPASTIIEIQTDWDDVIFFMPWFDYGDGSWYEGPVTPLEIHVAAIPEPATLTLLGLGGLLLKRRK